MALKSCLPASAARPGASVALRDQRSGTLRAMLALSIGVAYFVRASAVLRDQRSGTSRAMLAHSIGVAYFARATMALNSRLPASTTRPMGRVGP